MAQKKQEYQVKLDIFEGPLDLLLYLVNKSEVEITQISIASITHQYLQYLDIMRDLNINVAAEYLHMAATLIRLKVQELLPDTPVESSEDGEQIVSREQLIEKILEYKKFKEAAVSLRSFESEHLGTFGRGMQDAMNTVPAPEDATLASVTLFDLIAAFKRIMERSAAHKEDEYKAFLRPDDVRIDDRIEYLLCSIDGPHEVLFEDLFKDDARTIVLVVTFMALLELVKMKKIYFRQERQYGALYVRKREDISVLNMTQEDPA